MHQEPESPRRHLSGLLTVMILLIPIGCHPWYLVESSYQKVGLTEDPPEITTTREYQTHRGKALSVAIDAPDRCADQSSTEATGEATSAAELLRATCGVEMAELERALARAGHRVISWEAVREMVLHKAEVTSLEAARNLGAEVLLHVNSLEHSISEPGFDERWNRRFYKSDNKGTKGPLAEVPELRAQALEKGMRTSELRAVPLGRVSASIDATVVLVSSGEAIWFYRWTHSQAFESKITARQLFECNRRHIGHCIRQMPVYENQETRSKRSGPPHERGSFRREASGSPKKSGRTRSGSRGALSQPARDANEIEAVYYRLAKRVVDDLATRFTGPSVPVEM
jgi:hypothetical protein